MADRALPIPPAIWARIVAWLEHGGTGRITLDAHHGKVQDAWINERIRVGDTEPIACQGKS